MKEKEMITFLETLEDGDWEVSVSAAWTVKDVVAHLVGWTEVDVGSLENIDSLETFFSRRKDFDIDEYNAQVVEKYSPIPPQEIGRAHV